MKYQNIAFALIAISASANAVEYKAPGNYSRFQMHDETTWQQVCQTKTVCDVPPGTYQVKTLDANWNTLQTIRGVKITGSIAAPAPAQSSGGYHYESYTASGRYYGGWGKGPQPFTFSCERGFTVNGECRIRWSHLEDSDQYLDHIESNNALGYHCDVRPYQVSDPYFGSDKVPTVFVEVDLTCAN